MVSIMTTMVLMIVISLIVLGFAQISRRNQRESLDRQLSTQAFYAAETGVNDARDLIQKATNTGNEVQDKNGCTDSGVGNFYASLNPVVDAAKNVKYSCLLVDASPKTLRYSDIGANSVVVPMTSATGDAFNKIQLKWQSKLNTATPLVGCPTTAGGVFSPAASWSCGYGVLRFDLVPTGGSLNSGNLMTSTMTTFAVPMSNNTGTNDITYNAGSTNPNSLAAIKCTNTECSLQISSLTDTSYYMRISSVYRDVALQITGTTAGGSPVEIKGAQAQIDATGKAQDVLRRIQVSAPYTTTSQNQNSDYAIKSNDSICKRFSVANGYFANNPVGVVGSTNPLCQ